MTNAELNRFIKACLRDGREESLDLAREALRRLRQRSGD